MEIRTQKKLKVEYLKIASLIPYKSNPRIHDEAQINQLKASIEEFGFTSPILIDENNIVIAGHGRLEAAKQLEFESVATIRLIGLTDDQRRAYVIADNKLAMNANWDFELLQLEMANIEEVSLTGFSKREWDMIIGIDTSGKPKTGEINIDAMEFSHTCPKCRFEFND